MRITLRCQNKQPLLVVVLVLFICLPVFGEVNWAKGPECVPFGALLLNAAFDVGSGDISVWGYHKTDPMIGGTIIADYMLPIFGFMVGLESGYTGGSGTDYSYGVIPIIFRFGYHPDFGVKNLDVYGLVKAGIGIGLSKINTTDGSGIGFGFGLDVGGRYFFADKLAVFAELGFDRYATSLEFKSGSISLAYTLLAHKIFTIGLTYKINTGGKPENKGDAQKGDS